MAISLQRIFEMADIIHDHNLTIPRNIHLSEKSDGLSIEYSWFKLKYLLVLLLFPLCSYIVVQSPYVEGNINEITFPVWIIILLNIIAAYYCLTKVLNTTEIQVNYNRIVIKHGPLPMERDLIIKRSDLTQLYVTKRRLAHRYYLYSSTYQVNAILSNQHVVTLVKGLYEPEQGLFIERKIEKFLGITDISVEGEVKKD